MMTTREFLAGMGAAALGLCTAAPPVLAQVSTRALIRWAELDIDPAKLDSFKAAAIALKEAVLRMEPGVAAYHAVSEADNPGRIHVFAMYDDAEAYHGCDGQWHHPARTPRAQLRQVAVADPIAAARQWRRRAAASHRRVALGAGQRRNDAGQRRFRFEPSDGRRYVACRRCCGDRRGRRRKHRREAEQCLLERIVGACRRRARSR